MAYDGYINIDTRISTTEFKTGIAKMQGLAQDGAKIMTAAFAAVSAAVVAIGTAAVGVGSKFEASMSNVAAISGAAGEEFESLSEKAKQMGASTKFTASEAADAFSYMAMAVLEERRNA